ncbi:MAG TPA: peptidoglycan editing factor PgeF [Saprospiraceae bacterium]|nr:peptidoglycan editing factor PgeF [Saprospiraceae bacterium]
MKIICPEIFKQFENVAAAQSTRLGGLPSPFGAFNLGESVGDDPTVVAQNRTLFCESLGFDKQNLAKSKQVHGLEVLVVNNAGTYEGYDALITTQKGILLAVTIADCAPILLYDKDQKTIAAVHAGWKGTLGNLVYKTLQIMQNSLGTNPAHDYAYIGTCISSKNYEVDSDVALHFEEKYRPYHPNTSKYHLDIKQHNLDQLTNFGVPLKQIEVSPYCTLADRDLFYSHRGENGKAGRMLAGIGMLN